MYETSQNKLLLDRLVHCHSLRQSSQSAANVVDVHSERAYVRSCFVYSSKAALLMEGSWKATESEGCVVVSPPVSPARRVSSLSEAKKVENQRDPNQDRNLRLRLQDARTAWSRLGSAARHEHKRRKANHEAATRLT